MGASISPQVTTATAFRPEQLERVFADCFLSEYSTRLEGGATEPLYQPASKSADCHVLYYREDYFASALHEIAHWCIAGAVRRELTDFGYWYAPDGRTAAQQRAFEAVEYRPQAMEWHFARACGYRFRISVDNLDSADGAALDTRRFKDRVLAQALCWQESGLPQRAARFAAALRSEFGVSDTPLDFTLAGLY